MICFHFDGKIPMDLSIFSHQIGNIWIVRKLKYKIKFCRWVSNMCGYEFFTKGFGIFLASFPFV